MTAARRLLPLVSLAAIAIAACTTEQQSTPRSTLPSTTSITTTSTVPDAAPTTEAVATTGPTADTSTTTTAPPSGPADVTVPLLVGGGTGGGWLPLGSWQSDHWQSATDADDQPVAPSIPTGTAMTVTNLAGQSTGTAGDPVEACFDERVGPTLDVDVPAPDPPGFGYGSVAMTTQDWTVVPRPIGVASSGPPRYQEIGETIFAGQPVDGTNGAVEQVVVGDLDGDGDDEAIVSFEFVQQSAGAGTPGDFAALFVVDVDSRISATVLDTDVPSDLPPEAFPVTERYRVIAVADLNGDGRMEVAVHSWYYEGASVLLYEYDGETLVRALATGCGS